MSARFDCVDIKLLIQ